MFTKSSKGSPIRTPLWCGRQDSSTLWSTRRRAAGWQQSTGLLHLHGFESAAVSGAGDRTRVHYGAPGGNAGWQQSTGLLHLHGFESVARIPKKRAPEGLSFLVRATGLEPARLSQRNLNPPSLPIPPRPRVACNRVILSWERGNVNGRQPEPLKFPGGKGQFSQFLLSLSLTFRQDACKIT